MIHRKTVLILGAGASVPYGFPTGPELVRNIINAAGDKGSDLRQCLVATGVDAESILQLREGLEKTNFDSIDAFLEHHPQLREVGKLAIAAALIPCEREENLSKPPVPEQHWYKLLFQQLVAQGGFSSSKLSIISLNYDRSLQQFLFNALVEDLEMNHDEAARAVRNTDFIYLHGQLGEVPWRPRGGDASDRFTRAYQPTLDPEHIRTAASGILIVSELDWSRNPVFQYRVHSCLASADVVGFLGFGYNQTVIDRLDPAHQNTARPEFFGSAFWLPQGRRGELEQDFPGISLGGSHENVLQFLQSSRLLYQGRPARSHSR